MNSMPSCVVHICMFFFMFLCSWAGGIHAVSTPEQKLYEALTVLKEVQSIPDKGIPKELFQRCRGVAIFPSVYKGGFIVGASYGKGVLFAKDPGSNTWYGPVFLTIGAGSFGWQFGVKSTDLILVIMNERGLDPFFRNSVTLGGEIGVSAGPVGREVEASTDISLKSEIYSYSRSKGFFAGLSLEGAYVGHDYRANEIFWKGPYTPREILTGRVKPNNKAAQRVIEYFKGLSQ